ncbi:hypothetical protein DS745_00530 [Anaerobacillus alkaliphilus]|uniref:Uncharacterized protein n=1 Tax=Anaerobacillus alkaliphilus TaxID=1548597 RepID=A0A4Q0VW33_9BACI|nr:hypothetical protein [Anaerobacillus alkaliphilus]RXJ03913.1 hypothetical protein DS745_00530 [Anaerobacillus alkaliphilus]
MKKRVLLLLIGFWCLKMSMNMFPTLDVLTNENFIQKLVFEPFKLLGALLLFIFGFLAIARVIKRICEQIYKGNKSNEELLWIGFILVIFVFLGFQSFWLTVLAIGFSLFYGIMDANIRRRSRHYNN